MKIDLPTVKRYLGMASVSLDEESQSQIEEAEQALYQVANCQGTYQIFPIAFQEEGVEVTGTKLLLQGTLPRTMLKDCHHCIFLAVTLGQGVDRLIREWQVKDMAKAVILDACASSLAEEYCNFFEETITKEREGDFFSDRFSMGYGDFPLHHQGDFCKILQTEKKIGVSTSKTNLMTPKKSITALVGIADTPQPMPIKGCQLCFLKDSCTHKKCFAKEATS